MSVTRMRDPQGQLLPGFTEFPILSAAGPVDRVFSLWFARGERYETHIVDEQPPLAYRVSIEKSAGEGSVSFVHQTSSDKQLGGAVTGSIMTLPAVAAGVEGHLSSAQQTLLTRTANVQEIVFKVKGGTSGNFPGEVLSSISICVYTFSPQLAEDHKRRLVVEKVDRGVQTQLEKRDATTSTVQVERKEVVAQTEERSSLLVPTFGFEEWLDYFGVGVDPVPLPLSIRQLVLSNPMDYALALIPSEVWIEESKRPLDFPTGLALLEAPRHKGHPFLVSSSSRLPVQTGGVTRWVLLTKKSLAETLDQDYEKQVEMLKGHTPPYREPTAWEVFLCIALHQIHTGETLYATEGDRSSWTRCQQEGGKAPFVGGHDRKGLRIKPKEALPAQAPNIGMAGAL